MGCKLGKLAASSTGGAGLKTEEPPPPAPTDPRLPLTARQKYTIVASWKGISRAMESTGMNMFLRRKDARVACSFTWRSSGGKPRRAPVMAVGVRNTPVQARLAHG
ncbi:uncharacterized protein LOC116168155 [Photinus pyralis]|uniref:uncharacterized protein LOC116168155 n=1 Tax=Photinus pyralis TaxID=7054 RepID=UPI001267672C|nr:uncharacterized protein LOC116168155 [Photinus pyralis]XP_031339685.1 uncharacterized protein LOC116168155 [Photinus pyralis]